MTDDDAAPRVRGLRAEQTRLERSREDALAELEDTQPRGLDTEEVLHQTQDLKVLPSEGTLAEQRTFLRSFIRRIDLALGQVAIDYTVPMPIEVDRTSEREVLSIERLGSPNTTFAKSPCSLPSAILLRFNRHATRRDFKSSEG